MRYLRMLTNALTGGVLIATYLVVLVLQLNPQVPIASLTVVRWLRTLVAMYGLYLTVAIYLLILVREAIASRPLQPAWFSVRLIAWTSAAGAAGAAVITWANFASFQADLGAAAADRMRQGAVATTICAVLLVVIAIVRYSFGRKGSRATGVVLVVLLTGSVIVPLWLRGPGDLPVLPAIRLPRSSSPPDRATPHVRLMLLDGASYSFILERVAAGGLPNFGRIIDRGAHLFLSTVKPTEAVPVWAAAVTGKYPPKNGVRSDAIYRIGADEEEPVTLLPDFCFARSLILQDFVHEDPYLTSASLRARPFWAIASDYGVVPGIVNLPLTRLARAPVGFIVSDYLDEAFSPLRLSDEGAADPTTATAAAREVFDGWLGRPWTDAIPAAYPSEPPPVEYQKALWDHAYSDTMQELEPPFAPRLTAIRYEGLNTFGRWYLEDALPEQFGRFARSDRGPSVLDRYYTYIDAELGRLLNGLDPNSDDLLIVMSGFGMEQVPMQKRLLARLLGRPNPSGGHENAPDGFLLAYGANVARGAPPRGAIVDLAPTVLYYLGLPVGRDMDGIPRTDLFRASYTMDHPVTFTGTYETTRER